jgi:ubiquinone/menaquinone biosynthesis C-methylase UbiE
MMNANPQRLRAWRTVDTAADPHEFTRYLEQSSEHPLVLEFNRARLAAADLQPGSTVLDLGCGIGSDTLMLAEAVGPTGHVHAVDRSAVMIEAVARRAAERGLTITCQESDAASLPFPDRTFDFVWMERVLMHVLSPRDVLTEIRRVLREGGQIVAHEPDSGALMVSDGGDPELARLLEQRWSAGIAHPRVGRALEGCAHSAGLTDIQSKPEIVSIKDFELACAALRWRDVLASLVDDRMVSKRRADAWLHTVEAEAQGSRVICWSTRFNLFARR